MKFCCAKDDITMVDVCIRKIKLLLPLREKCSQDVICSFNKLVSSIENILELQLNIDICKSENAMLRLNCKNIGYSDTTIDLFCKIIDLRNSQNLLDHNSYYIEIVKCFSNYDNEFSYLVVNLLSNLVHLIK